MEPDKIRPQEAETVLFTGHAKPPSSITAEKVFQVITVGIEVDSKTGIIVDCDVTLASNVAKNFFHKLVLGYSLADGIDGLTEKFEARYHGSARKAILTCLRSICEKWIIYKNTNT